MLNGKSSWTMALLGVAALALLLAVGLAWMLWPAGSAQAQEAVGYEPADVRVVPGDRTLTVSWKVTSRPGVSDDQIRHALRWSQQSGVWANPKGDHAVGRNDGVSVEPGVTSYLITGLENGTATGVFVRSFTGPNYYERAKGSSKWVRTKGDHTTPREEQQANNAPTVASAIADATIVNESGTKVVSLTGVFADADNDSLTVTAKSSDTAKATVSVATDGSSLTVTAKARGTATITVSAADGNGGTVEDGFTVTVKAAPVVAHAISDVSGLEAGDTRKVSLTGVFSDADGDALTVTAASSSNAVVKVSADLDGSGLTVVAKDEGTATVTVTAQDTDGNSVSDEFSVTVASAQQKQQQDQSGQSARITIRVDTAFGNLVGWVPARGEGALVSGDATFGDRAVNGLIRMDAGRVRLSMETGTASSEFPTRIEISDGAGYTATFDSPSGFTARGLGMQADYSGDASGLTAGRQVTVALGEPAPTPANNAPTVSNAIADVSGLKVGDTRDVPLSGVFTDADGDALTITAASWDTARVTVEVASDGSKLTLTGVAEGTATITVTSQDADGNLVSDAFQVPVVQAQPSKNPTAPSNLTAEVVDGGVALSWNAPTEDAGSVTGYSVEMRTQSSEFLRTYLADTGSAKTSYIVAGAAVRGKTYVFQVKARRGAALRDSNEASVSIPGACPIRGSGPVAVPVSEIPIVVPSTTSDYFVLYVRQELGGETVEVPVSVTLGAAGTTTLADNLEALPPSAYRVERYLVEDPADIDGDCIDDITELRDLGSMNPVNPAPAVHLIYHGAVGIPDRETFETLSYQGGWGTIDRHLTGLEIVKFSIVGADRDRPVVYFQNTQKHRIHWDFLRSIPSGGRGGDLRIFGRYMILGEVIYHPNVVAPDGSLGVYRYEFEHTYRDAYSFEDVAKAHEVLAASMPLLQDNLAYYPMPSRGVTLYHKEKALYDASRINVLFDEDIFPDVDFTALNEGEGYGYLRVMTPEERPNPRDVVIYETLPNTLPRVAGIITTVPQTPLSHVNLRAVQDDIPNAFIRGALDDSTIDSLLDGLVYYQVTQSGYTLRAATKAEVDAHYESSRPTEAQTPERDLSVTQITALSEVGFDDWEAFGVKAANVAVLGTLDFPEGTVPNGFAVPFYFYDEFMKNAVLAEETLFGKKKWAERDKFTLAAGTKLSAVVTAMLAHPRFQADYEIQAEMLDDLRDAIKDAESPQWIIDALTAMHTTYPEGQSLRYRSSTNNEDLPGFSGAGLYGSKTQDPDETEEDGIDKSIKGVWASLWNFRAFVERDLHRVDHTKTAMGVLVHPNYSDELANGVAVSFDPFSGREGAYYVNTQVGEDLVTNPKAHSVPEEVLLLPDGSYEVLARSNQRKSRELLMSDAQLKQLRGHLKVIHERFAALYNPAPDTPFAMEIEFKITSDNILAIKQARPWVFGAATASEPERQTANSAPTVASAIADATIVSEDGTHEASLSSVFADADGDALTVSARSSDTAKATVSVATDGSSLTVTAKARGTATVTVTANDGNGGTVEDAFTVTVKAAPVVAQAISDVSGLEVGDTREVSLTGVFSDADGDSLTITAGSSKNAVATVTASLDGTSMTVAGAAQGTATITVSAQDSDGNRATATFDVTVNASNQKQTQQPTGPEPWDIRIVPGDGILTVTWRVGSRDDVDNSNVRHALRWSQESGVWANPPCPAGLGRNDGFCLDGGVTQYVITGLTNDVATGVFVRSFVGSNNSERNPNSSQWVRIKGDNTTPKAGQQQPAPQQTNNAPTVANAIADATMVTESGSHQVSLSNVFADADGDSLTVKATSSDTAKATVSVSTDQSMLTVAAKSRGTATITVTADDGNGGTVDDTFTVTVKAAPTVASAIADVSGLTAGDTQEVSLSGVFSDADGDSLTITAASSSTDKVTAAVASDGSNLTLTGVAEGTATITVTAQDSDGNQASDPFQVSVAQAQQQAAPEGPEPWDIRIVPGDGQLTVTWRISSREGVDDSEIRHALRWSQESGVWANPRCGTGTGANDGLCLDAGVTSYVITGLKNGVPTGVFVRSFTGDSASERSPDSSKWVRIKGDNTTPKAAQ